MVLEDSTLEEAMWALSQITGLCHLSLRPRQDGMSHGVFIKHTSISDVNTHAFIRKHCDTINHSNDVLALAGNNSLLLHLSQYEEADSCNCDLFK